MKYLNKENVTALVIVVAGVLLATIVAPTVIGWFNSAKAKVTG
jgi:hypothetical protein